jgi:tetratricopeptide (TPR) repeat protein
MDTNSALPQLFKAEILADHFVYYRRLNQLGWSDAARATLDNEVVSEFDKALLLDPDLLPALKGRALAHFHLKEFQKAIADYDRVLSLDPQDSIDYNDRGLAKLQLGRNDEAISDFSAAIKIKKRELMHSSSYENRADAYMKSQQWGLAIDDLTTAISLQIGGMVLLSNISQFRALYPEYQTVADEAIARKLIQTFHPNYKYEDFLEGFLHHDNMVSTIIPDLFLKRSDAYLKSGNWHRASIDFRRAVNGFPEYAKVVDRWREISQMADAREDYIDMKTFDDARKDSIRFWIKEARGSSEAVGPYSLKQFELNCDTRQIRTASIANYDASGELTSSGQGSRWQSIIPETVGETLYNSTCRSN